MVYIALGDDILELTVTTEVSISYPSDVTQHPMEFGSNVADNLVNRNVRYSFSGMVSNMSSLVIDIPEPQERTQRSSGYKKPFQKDVPDYFILFKKFRDLRQLVTFYFDPQVDQGGIVDCVIVNVNAKKQPSHGDAYLLDFELEQVRISERAKTYEKTEQRVPDQTQKETNSATTSTTTVEKDTKSLLLRAGESIPKAFSIGGGNGG